jgi:TonB family protein
LNELDLSRALGGSEASESTAQEIEKAEASSDSDRRAKLRDYQPFRSPSISQLFTGSAGNADFLPNVPDGDVTLLNAKADRFAVFVRRVALQVFAELRRRNWQQLPAAELGRIRGFTKVIATMNRNGELTRVEILDSSGSEPFDRVLEQSARAGTWDRNPPPAAAGPDGNFRFFFEARSWGQFGGPNPRRWLLLAVGLL